MRERKKNSNLSLKIVAVFQRDMTVVTARCVNHRSNKILPFYINNTVGDKRGQAGQTRER